MSKDGLIGLVGSFLYRLTVPRVMTGTSATTFKPS